MTVSTMEPGDLLLMQMKQKFPSPKKNTKERTKKPKKAKTDEVKVEKPKKSKKKTKKAKKEKKSVLEDDVLSAQSDSSSQPASRSTDSGNVSDSNSSKCGLISNASDIEAQTGEAQNSLTSIETIDNEEIAEEEEVEAKEPPKKLSNRLAFFEQAIIKASTTKRRSSIDKDVTTSSKRDAFLAAVQGGDEQQHQKVEKKEKKEITTSKNVVANAKKSVAKAQMNKPVKKEKSTEELYEADSEIDLSIEDPLDQTPKCGMLYFTQRDIRMEKKLIKKVASSIEENGIVGVRPMLMKKLQMTERVKIGVMGDSMSGKSSLIEALGGDVASMVNKYTGRLQSCYQPTNVTSTLANNVVFTELPGLADSGRYSAETYANTVDLDEFDVLVMLTATWFKKKHINFANLDKEIIYVRTKVDDSVANDQKSRRGEHNENAVVNKVRNHCEETLGTERDLCLVTTKQLNKFDGDILVQKLIDAIQGKKSDAIVQGILPTCLEVIQRKRDLLMSRIWKVAAISTVSGVMPIPGFNLTADLDFLRAEIQLYRAQFGITDQTLEDSSNCPEIVDVWNVITNGDGLISLLRQSAMDQEWAEFSKFMNKLPLIGGNVSFAATCSILKYCLNELCQVSIRQNDMSSRLWNKREDKSKNVQIKLHRKIALHRQTFRFFATKQEANYY